MTGHPNGRVLLHVGSPKTGTSYFQDVMFRNRHRLAGAGMLYPADRFDAHFLAALDLMRLPWGGLETEAVGAWDDVARRVRRRSKSGGTSVISHEILAAASRSQVGRALESLGLGSAHEPEIHVVLSARDLVRQIPAEWQENVKHRSAVTYARFLAQIRDPDRASRIAAWFWSVQEVPDVLARWAVDLPPERVHVVTVPPPGGEPDLLWQRFVRAFGLDDAGLPDLDLDAGRVNPSLGVPETALLRRVNRAANRDLPPADYRPLVRELLAHNTLSQRRKSPRLGLPPELHGWVGDLERSWVREIETRGYHVVGDLADLVGTPPAVWADPDQPAERQVAAAGVDAVKALLLEAARLQHREAELRAELDDAHRALERAYLRPTYRWREKTVRRLQHSDVGRQALGAYRRVRGRNSASA